MIGHSDNIIIHSHEKPKMINMDDINTHELIEKPKMISNSDDIVIMHSHELKEKPYSTWNGCLVLFLNILILIIGFAITIIPLIFKVPYTLAIGIPIIIFSFIIWKGFFIVEPSTAMVLIFYGKYRGTVRKLGFHWVNPFTSFKLVSLKLNNLDGIILKVNDRTGNPIDIACNCVWRIKDTVKANFDVVDTTKYVTVQSESALRHIASVFPYDKGSDSDEVTLRSGNEIVNRQLQIELQERMERAGIEIIEARISNLAYSAEISSVMLKRQQAEAIIMARNKIVQGAVSIVGQALHSLQENTICTLKDDERSKLVSNLLVVLCSETHTVPTIRAD
jgi:hypothetical protein